MGGGSRGQNPVSDYSSFATDENLCGSNILIKYNNCFLLLCENLLTLKFTYKSQQIKEYTSPSCHIPVVVTVL